MERERGDEVYNWADLPPTEIIPPGEWRQREWQRWGVARGLGGERGEVNNREREERGRGMIESGDVKWEVGREVTGRQSGTLRHSSWKTGFRAQIAARRK